jgi:hypothetical protein
LPRISAEYQLSVLLQNFKNQLQRLELHDCKYIDLAQLAQCEQLQELELGIGCVIKLSTTDINPNTFLPNLKKMTSKICLGQSSALFETSRPSLTLLNLSCVHIGISSASNFCCEDIPGLWPNLETLSICSARGLTLEKFQHVIPQLVKLKELELPSEDMCRSDEDVELFHRLDIEFEGDVEIIFQDDFVGCVCPSYESDDDDE